jgi:hypothetical protein
LKNLTNIPAHEALNALWCPFPIEFLEQNDFILAWFTQYLKHLVAGQDGAPWTGYYAMHQGAKFAVSNCYGIWFEIQYHEYNWIMVHPTHISLNLQGDALDGINASELIKSGEPLLTLYVLSQVPSHMLSWISLHSELEKDEPIRIPAGHSTKMECQPLWRPQSTGDDPFGVSNLDLEPLHSSDNNIHLEGIPPNKFEGDRVKPLPFLTQFKQFMLMNCHVEIMQDPYMKSAFFLSLMEGLKVKGWMQCTYNWLNQVKANPTLLLFKMSAWQALEADFKWSFIDYAEHEHTQDEMRKLKMKDSNVDEYITAF